jgi:cytoskeletal protein RodZ
MSAQDMSQPEENAAATGDRLRAGREAAGLSLAQLSETTKIPTRHLEALEAGNLAALPGRTYALGFARTYARAVGLDEDEIVAAMRKDYSGAAPAPYVAPTPAFAPGDPARVPSSGFAWLAGIVALLVAVGGYVWWQNYYTPSAELPSLLPADTPTATATASPAPEQSAAPTPQPTTPSGPVVFTAQGDAVWVRFYDGTSKKVLQEKSMTRGETYTVPGDVADPRLWTGHPEQLDITIGGQGVPRLAEQMKTMKDVSITAAALQARGNAPASPAPSSTSAPSDASSAQPSTDTSLPGAAPSTPPHKRHPRRRRASGETVTAGGVLPAGVPLVSSPAATTQNP